MSVAVLFCFVSQSVAGTPFQNTLLSDRILSDDPPSSGHPYPASDSEDMAAGYQRVVEAVSEVSTAMQCNAMQ